MGGVASKLSQEQIMEAAQILQSPKKRSRSSQDTSPSPAKRRIAKLTQAIQVLDGELKKDDTALRTNGLDYDTIQVVRGTAPKYSPEELKAMEAAVGRMERAQQRGIGIQELLRERVKSEMDLGKDVR